MARLKNSRTRPSMSKKVHAASDDLQGFMSLFDKNAKLLSREEEVRLKKEGRIQDLINSNLGLVRSIVYKFNRRNTDNTVTVTDLMSAGVNGLFVGVRKFDPDRGTRLTTVAAWWITKYVRIALMRSRLIKTSYSTAYQTRRIFEFMKANPNAQETMSIEDIAANCNARPWVVDMFLKFDPAGRKAEFFSGYTDSSDDEVDISIQDPADRDDSTSTDVSVQKAIWHSEDMSKVRSAMSSLSDRECDIISSHYLGGDVCVSMADLAKRYGISQNRIKQIITASIKKIQRKIFDDK